MPSRNTLTDSRFAEVVKPDGWQYTLKHGRVLAEAIAVGIEPLEFCLKEDREMRFDLVRHDPGTHFSTIAKQQRGQQTNDCEELPK